METLYDILEVSQKASKEVIDKAYKTLAKKYHPDLQSPENRKQAEEMMKKINEAYEILSDETKRSNYDKELAQKENKSINNQPVDSYNNVEREDTTNYQKEADWKSQFSKLSPKEQRRITKKIQKEANEEYRRQYERYFRSLGYKIKHKWTIKDLLVILIAVAVCILVITIMWLIPSSHDWMLKMYKENFIIKLVVNIFIGIIKGIIEFFKNIGHI